MKSFNVKIKKIQFELLELEIDIILKCLRYYMYNEFTLNKKNINEKQNLERNLIKDTYDQLLMYKQEDMREEKKVKKNNFKKFA